ncbi:hypothetical protein [Modestobacter altitudinis]|uniref:hypothetical protein n=1 Tax=Modestobacter altitudinis TaxID=2213158 RepID=UPI00110CD91E|nr:hypothetical protein [Modestobacter altitudinis]
MQTWEHGTLRLTTAPLELTFHTAGGATVATDGVGPRHVMQALDALSEDGWEVMGPPTPDQAGGVVMATSYLLRRPRSAGEPPVH